MKTGEFKIYHFFNSYISWWKGIIKLDFGFSLKDGRPVFTKILERIPATLELNIISILASFIIALPISLYAVHRGYGKLRKAIDFIINLLFSLPNFWIALVLSIFFGLQFGDITNNLFGITLRLPISGMRSLKIALNPSGFSFLQKFLDQSLHLILPVICASIFNIALIYSFFTTKIEEIMSQNFIRALRARGIPEHIILIKHAGKNAIFPLLTLLSLLVPTILSSNFIIETIFSWPGIGRLGFDSIMTKDYPVVMGLSLITTIFVVSFNFIIEILYSLLNPRISRE